MQVLFKQLCIGDQVIGNHDLDFGVENLREKIHDSHFPWLCSNCWHKDTGLPLAGSVRALRLSQRKPPSQPASQPVKHGA